jgi:hypothetical protein
MGSIDSEKPSQLAIWVQIKSIVIHIQKGVMSRIGLTMVAKGKLFLRLCLPDDFYSCFL